MSVLVPIQAQELHLAHSTPGARPLRVGNGRAQPGTNGHAAIPEPEC
jgi:hypothetical protein